MLLDTISLIVATKYSINLKITQKELYLYWTAYQKETTDMRAAPDNDD